MNLYHGLLFQSGHIVDPKLAMLLGSERRQSEQPHEPVRPPVRPSHTSRLRWLIEEMVLLGGRPISRPHYDDIEEPFPPLHGCG